jgi:hypothetical protein
MLAISSLGLIVALNACMVKQTAPSKPNPRIVARDLTKPYPEPRGLTEEPERGNPPSKIFVIHFGDGSTVLPASGFFTEVMKHVTNRDEVLVVGHSHGRNDERSSYLSTQRTMAVASYLQRLGAKKIYYMASWGPPMNPYDPTKGVQIFIMKGGGARQPGAQRFEAPPEELKADDKRKKI